MKSDQQSDVLQRLRCTAGHLNAVIEMVEAGQPCERVLHQLNAVQAALQVTGTTLVIFQVQSSQAILRHSPSQQRRMSELKRLQSLYAIFNKYSRYSSEVFHD